MSDTADINPPFFYAKNDYIGVNSAENQQKSAENLLKKAIKLRIRTENLRRETKNIAEYLRAKSEKLGNSKGGK